LKSISLIGGGNVAFHLYHHIKSKGIKINEIYVRNPKSLKEWNLDEQETIILDKPSFHGSSADLILIAVKDDAIDQILDQITFKNEVIVAHTSGNKGLEALDSLQCSTAVFYPFQTFSKTRSLDLNGIPVCIETNDPQSAQRLYDLATNLDFEFVDLDSSKRKSLHLAAVFANNFTNYLLHVTTTLAEEKNLSLDLFTPLINETIRKARDLGPLNAQTGPARRGDLNVLNEHLRLLEKYPGWKEIYHAISDSILKEFADK
jgi:predicted short-subunit dehydrogenase-like oxidoreductase (DUF2520 family)